MTMSGLEPMIGRRHLHATSALAGAIAIVFSTAALRAETTSSAPENCRGLQFGEPAPSGLSVDVKNAYNQFGFPTNPADEQSSSNAVRDQAFPYWRRRVDARSPHPQL
jgi:hypothetical protein